ncbi:sulfite exporter TauE/SafE family protein [Parvibaculum sp.]|uniref:sulfite exporter TauE/SafE family protein n=1 Tax=Parvibaculum sp. TaxID=2024848 RepID=UPI002732014F|nr:sulfite exporter TauE/SafE family protein [Parvibaculum sp.]MDP1627613.1 sulfite exporter TauE/SafE family protein [Parvibaculum sp.]MDP2148792.1 sulfite exporter TauE/SafE family protein [Parvibaculum sp.]MDP3328684.1 sulfite exporter TauE/SafE family protein [Parvibaculum sp.]
MNIEAMTLMELAPFAAGLVVTGLVAGVLAGLLGVGGGIVIVPVLYHVFTLLGIDEAVRMHLAVGTSLGTIILTSIRSVRAHAKKGAVDWDMLKSWALPILVGVASGTLIAAYVGGDVLTAVFATIALVVAANLAFGKESWRLGTELPGKPAQYSVAGVIGMLSALMGIGGGTFAVSFMTLYGKNPREAVATSSGLGVLIAVPAVIGFIWAGWNDPLLPPFSLGYVNLIGMALIAPLSVLAAPWGAALAHAISPKALIRAFALFLALTSLQMFYRLFG